MSTDKQYRPHTMKFAAARENMKRATLSEKSYVRLHFSRRTIGTLNMG